MKAPIASQRSAASANLTPMIDVVFLLIIFFLVSSHLAKQEHQLPLPLPTADSHAGAEQFQDRLTIHITQDGSLYLSSNRITLEQLAQTILRRQDPSGTLPSIRMRVDRSANYQQIEPVLHELTKAGVVDIAFAVQDGIRP